jgi:hypothetical protein
MHILAKISNCGEERDMAKLFRNCSTEYVEQIFFFNLTFQNLESMVNEFFKFYVSLCLNRAFVSIGCSEF